MDCAYSSSSRVSHSAMRDLRYLFLRIVKLSGHGKIGGGRAQPTPAKCFKFTFL